MKIRDITEILESTAQLSWQESYDNSGLIVGDKDGEIESVLLAVDITEDVLNEAIEIGAGMIIAHHPIIFHPLKQLVGQTYVERVVVRAIGYNIALYACHTNLDSAPEEGLSYRLGKMLELGEMFVLEPTRSDNPKVGFGIVSELKERVEMVDFLRYIQKNLKLSVVRHSPLTKKTVKRVAICSGSGSSLIAAAKRENVDLYIAADFKYNDFLDADRELVIADIGHFESEFCAIDTLFDILSKKIPTFALRKSKNSINPINYIV